MKEDLEARQVLNFFVIPPRLMRLIFLMSRKPSLGVSTLESAPEKSQHKKKVSIKKFLGKLAP